jgi:N-acetylglucosamine malate deacetylase 1
MNILIVAAHPDDEILGAGGAMLWHLARKDKVDVLILGEGVTARFPNRGAAPEKESAKLRKRSLAALRFLGVRDVFYRDFPDNRFDSLDLLDLVKEVSAVKEQVRPSVIYTHHCGDLNIDHRLTFQAVLTATRPLKNETVRRVLSFEVPSSTEWNFAADRAGFTPNVFLDISLFLSRKLKAFSMYGDEVMPDSHPRSLRGVRTLAEWRGLQSGSRAAEAFMLLRDLP